MSAESLVQVVLMAFVLLAPVVMVVVLVSGLSRRGAAESDGARGPLASTGTTPTAASTAASRSAA